MKQIKITSKDGVTLHTANKFVDEDIAITIAESLFESGGSATIKTKGGWQGTPLPPSGYLENVYFNINASPESVIDTLDAMATQAGMSIEETVALPLFRSSDGVNAVHVLRENGGYLILDDHTETIYFAYLRDETQLEGVLSELGFAGWNPILNETNGMVSVNKELVDLSSELGDSYELWSMAMEIFSSFVSSTPFVQSEGEEVKLSGEYDGSTVEITDLSGGWQGTTVPNNSYVENVYFNTNLSVEEVVSIVNKADLTYGKFDDESLGYGLLNTYDGENKECAQIILLTNIEKTIFTIFNFTGTKMYFSTETGWNADIEMPIVINYVAQTSGADGVIIGSDNHKLTELFSTTPFTKSEPNTIDIKKYLEEQKLPLKVKVNLESSGSSGTNTSDATASASDILLGKTAYGADGKMQGTIETYDGASDVGSSEEYPSEAIAYYKQTRNKNYPYLPLPYEMEETETQDTIYMLYDASGYMCCPVFNITFTECVCTIQKYMNTTLVSEYVESVTSGTTKRMQFSEEDSDYSAYNYIVIKLQGNITKHYLNYPPKFNGIAYIERASNNLIEVSGKCVSCDIKVNNGNYYVLNKSLKYYSFVGVSTSDMSNMFRTCRSLKYVPQLDTSNVTNMKNMFYECTSLETIPQLDTHLVTSMHNMFYECTSLETIPQLDTSNVTSMYGMFEWCRALQTIPQLDTHLVTSMSSMFRYCFSLQTIPELDTSNVTSMSSMFESCDSLQTIPQLDTHLVTSMSSMFNYCFSLQVIPELDMSSCNYAYDMFYWCRSLNKLNIINAKISISDLSDSTMLSQSELVKILNNLATVETTQTLKLGSTNLAKLTDEQKAIAQNKGWSVA